jgi:hypothetical protein
MQVHAHLAHADRQQRERLAHDGDDLALVRAQLAPDDLARDRDGERDERLLDRRVELLESGRANVRMSASSRSTCARASDFPAA